ncbi:ribonuclease 1-like [Gossypium australe]|uniref:Ribonuclease 1-like n=1 Tax=Gossypium australe TaxID=47621 RepID=A0A5B6X854_9ROSI|nr:ribonuclease 1-like [Gossypium australe]
MVAVGGLMVACLLVGISCGAVEAVRVQERRLSSGRILGSTDPNTTFAFYKFSLQWPPASCDSSLKCVGDIPAEFTIHGLWPQLSNDKGVPAYAKNKSCTTLTPTRADQLPNGFTIVVLLMPYHLGLVILQTGNLVQQLMQAWPDLKNTSSLKTSQTFWSNEWTKHGMCSDYGDKPLDYFKAAINLRNNFVQAFKLERGVTYKVEEIVKKVKAAVNGTPEIACRTKKGGKGAKILLELRLCYKKGNPTPQGIQDCKVSYSGVCKSTLDELTLL